MELASFLEFLDNNIDGGLLETGGKVGDLLVGKVVFELVGRGSYREIELVLDGAEDSGLDAAKGEIESVDFWNRELVFVWIAV